MDDVDDRLGEHLRMTAAARATQTDPYAKLQIERFILPGGTIRSWTFAS